MRAGAIWLSEMRRGHSAEMRPHRRQHRRDLARVRHAVDHRDAYTRGFDRLRAQVAQHARQRLLRLFAAFWLSDVDPRDRLFIKVRAADRPVQQV